LGCQRQKHGAAMNWRVALVILAALGAAVAVFVTWPWSDAAWWGITIIACIALVGLIYDEDQRRNASRDAEILREIRHLQQLIDDFLAEVRARRGGRMG
jgi:peptidoglycan/LPS O-acetylase OafA/YrhL